MKLEQQIAVMQAFKDGKEIEVYCNDNTWGIALSPSWNWMHNTYRVKPTHEIRKRYHYIDSVQDNVVIKITESFTIRNGITTVINLEVERHTPTWK